MALQHLRSNTASKRPTAAAMSDGQIAVNTNATSPGLFFKDAGGTIVKVGPVHVGTSAPNSSPAAGGSTGNAVGEQWLDTSGGGYVLKIWDGSAWRSEAGEFVDVAGDTMTGALILPSGTAAAPALGVGSTDNGIYSPGADQVALATNGTGRLFVDSAGKIGVGSASTGSYFRVLGLTGASIIEAVGADSGGFADVEIKSTGTSGASRLYFSDTAGKSGLIRYSHSTNSLEFTTNGSEKLRLDSSGRLLVGTSSQAGGSLLQVNDDRIRIATAKTPASASDTGTTGEICWDSSYIYVCTATDTWKRAALSTW